MLAMRDGVIGEDYWRWMVRLAAAAGVAMCLLGGGELRGGAILRWARAEAVGCVAAAGRVAAGRAAAAHDERGDAMALPRVMLWAWERPDDLSAISSGEAGVAYLAGTIYLRARAGDSGASAANGGASAANGGARAASGGGTGAGVANGGASGGNGGGSDANDSGGANGGFVFRPRLQPLRVASGVTRLPVVRIETSRAAGSRSDATVHAAGNVTGGAASDTSDDLYKLDQNKPPPPKPVREGTRNAAADIFTAAQRERVIETLAKVAATSQPAAIQIDFDATASERAFYASLLGDLRRRLGPDARISITALVSWCEGDAWLASLPAGTIDEAVPMLFRMGPDGAHVAGNLRDGGEFRVAACRSSAGISDDERFSRAILSGSLVSAQPALTHERIYVFHSGTWNATAATADLGELEKWHVESSVSR